MKKLTVYGGTIFYRDDELKHGQYRIIVGAYTKKQAAELCKLKPTYFTKWFCETGNDVELSVATDVGVWIMKEKYTKTKDDFKKITL